MKSRIYLVVLWMLIAATPLLFALPQENLPCFTENKGQIRDIQGKSRTDILYSIELGGVQVFYRQKGISYVFRSGDSLYRADMNFTNALQPKVYATQQVAHYRNFYTANGSYENVRQYQSIIYENIYTGIDAVITLKNGQLKTNFLLHPGATAQAISLQYIGATPQVQSDGSLRLATPYGSIAESAPLSYVASSKENTAQQSNQTLASAYTTTAQSVGFSLAPYDNTRLTVIDPITTFATYYGGSGSDSTTSAIAEANGIVVCGVTTSSNFPTSAGVQQSAGGGKDAFAVKFDASGARVWSTYLGGSGDDVAFGLCKTPNNNIAVVGSTSTQSNFTTAGVLQANYGGGGSDGFVCVLNGANGVRNTCSYFGGSNNDECHGITTDAAGNIIFCGTTQSNNIPMTTHQKTYNGGKTEGMLIKASANLATTAWSTYYGGIGEESGVDVGAMPDGSVIFCGTTTTPFNDIDIAENVTEGLNEFGQTDVFLAKFSPNDGKRVWGRYYGGTSLDYVTRLYINGNNMYLCGYTNSVNSGAEFLATSGTAQNNFAGGANDGFLAKFSPEDGKRVWGTYHGGNGDDRCTNITTAANGDIFLSGMTNSATFPLKFSDQKTNAGGYDAFLGYYTTDGSKRIASVIYGGSGDDIGNGIAWLNDGKVFMSGSTNSSNFPTEAATQNANAGSFDLFLVKFVDLSILSVDEKTTQATEYNFITPNPVHERITISAPELTTQATLRIRNLLGAIVYQTTYTPNATSTTSIDISFLARGTYSVELQSAQVHYQQLVVKE